MQMSKLIVLKSWSLIHSHIVETRVVKTRDSLPVSRM